MSVDSNEPDKTTTSQELLLWVEAFYGQIAVLILADYLKRETLPEQIPLFEETGGTPPFRADSMRAVLDFILTNGWTDAQSVRAATEQLLEQLHTRTVPDTLQFHLPVLATLDSRLEETVEQYVKSTKRRAMLSSILWAVGTVAVLGAFAYWLFAPASTPACDASETQNALTSIATKANAKTIMRNMRRLAKPENRPPSFSFRNLAEVGYDKETGSRYCTATIAEGVKDSDEKIGYVIERDPDDSDEFLVQMRPVKYVMAQSAYSAHDKKLGAPVGRAAMQMAVMEELRKMDKAIAAIMPGYENQRPGDNAPNTYAESVKNVLPTADCHEHDEGRYVCPVQIEFHDRLLATLGASPWLLLRGNFVFEREGDGWKAVDGFENTFMRAIAESRFGIDGNESNQ